ncbi:MAG: DUF4426 domain-containing protein [Chromatiales bacterium]|jgi:hypothetical protein|nr:MAG: DUF4426 domain-containing protein [Chromatiales bacterium]
MNTKRKITRLACVPLLLASLLTSCGQSPPPPLAAAAPALEPATSSSRDFGNYVLHFNAIRTDTLTPEIAKIYNIVRSANRALLNISMVKKVEGTSGVPVAGRVSAQAVNLNGQFKDLTLREIREGDAIYYIGDVLVADHETLVFTVEATPEDESSLYSVRFQREFFGG